jgi:hypothetical protein
MEKLGNRCGSALLVGGLLFTLAGTQALAANYALNPAADAFVTSSNPAGNYGAAGALSAAASGLAKGEFESVMRFDTSPAKSSFDSAFGPGGWCVESVTLKLTAAAPGNPIFNASGAGNFAIDWMLSDSWIEGTGTPSSPGSTGITYNTIAAYVSPSDASVGTFAFNGATAGATTYSLSVPPALAGDLLAGGLVSLRVYPDDSTVSFLFNSGNNGTVGNRPVLTITAKTPEPASLGLLALAGAWLLKRGRRA